MRTIHVYRAAHSYFVDGIYWGDDAEGVRFYLQVTGVPPEEITKALEQVEQEGTYTVETGGGAHARAIRVSAGGHEAGAMRWSQGRQAEVDPPEAADALPTRARARRT
jgi:hypothetical protein